VEGGAKRGRRRKKNKKGRKRRVQKEGGETTLQKNKCDKSLAERKVPARVTQESNCRKEGAAWTTDKMSHLKEKVRRRKFLGIVGHRAKDV